MALIIAGIDEAGYGPLLGPLTVGMAVLRVEDWSEGQPAPDLWKRLASGVCKTPDRANQRVAVADSKALKLPNSGGTRHPLTHLERGVLAFLLASGSESLPADDGALFARLGAATDGHDCYRAIPRPIPVAWSADQIAISANVVRSAAMRAGVSVCALRCRAICEPEFNRVVERDGSKAAPVVESFARHLREAWNCRLEPGDSLRIVCDRLGGRESYATALSAIAPSLGSDSTVEILGETPNRSRYRIGAGGRHAIVSFQVEAESAHLPVALASMVAKLVRELAMARFNAYWRGRARADGAGDLKPTAGYRLDARRWLRDAAPLLNADDRRDLVRRA